MEPPLNDEGDALAGVFQVSRGRDGEQRLKIQLVLETTIVPGQQLQSDQVPDPHHRHVDLRPDLQAAREGHDLVLDPRTAEQQVHEDLGLPGTDLIRQRDKQPLRTRFAEIGDVSVRSGTTPASPSVPSQGRT